MANIEGARAKAADAGTDDPSETSQRPSALVSIAARWRRPLLFSLPIVAIVAAAGIYLRGGRYETTENAALQAGLISVSANVDGRVVAVEVRNNEQVHKGEILFRIDPAPFALAVQEAEAQLAQARTKVAALRANHAVAVSELAAARQRALYANREVARQKDLLAEGISSQAQFDQAALAARTTRQAADAAVEQGRGIAAQLAGALEGGTARHPEVREAQAALDRARLKLNYTVVRAPQDGIVARVDQLQAGDWVTAERPVFVLAGTRMWVEANFKESQLRHMRVGQIAKVRLDAYPDVELAARISSFSPGTGSSFAVLPAENATGNWVKVIQRLPVELELGAVPAGILLHSGLSAEVTVDTRHRRHLFAASHP